MSPGIQRIRVEQDGETEAQSGAVTCSGSHSESGVQPNSQSGALGTEPCSPTAAGACSALQFSSVAGPGGSREGTGSAAAVAQRVPLFPPCPAGPDLSLRRLRGLPPGQDPGIRQALGCDFLCKVRGLWLMKVTPIRAAPTCMLWAGQGWQGIRHAPPQVPSAHPQASEHGQ